LICTCQPIFTVINQNIFPKVLNTASNKQYILCLSQTRTLTNRIGGIMVSVLASSVADQGFEPRSGQAKDYKIGICCFSAKHAALRSKSKDWLARNQNNVSKWSDMLIRGLLFQWASTIKIQLSVLVSYKVDLIIISLKINLFSPWYSWKLAELALNNNHSLTQDLDFQRHISWFVLCLFRWAVVVSFLDINDIINHHCLNSCF
jgi:hypothetical protein